MDLRQEGTAAGGVVERVDYDNGDVYVGLTKDQIKNSPEFNESTYRDEAYRTSVVGDYYGQSGSRNDRYHASHLPPLVRAARQVELGAQLS
jgi:stress response protein YsnF